MYKYAATDSIFDGISNIYLISITTAFLAVIIAFYYSNFLKDESEEQLNNVSEDDEELREQNDNLNDTPAKIGNHNQFEKETQKCMEYCDMKHSCDYKDNGCFKNNYTKSDSSISDNSDVDYDFNEMHVDGLVSKMKSKRVKELEAQLTSDQLEEERRIEREQLAAIFELLKKQEAELNMKEIDESELNDQLALYR